MDSSNDGVEHVGPAIPDSPPVQRASTEGGMSPHASVKACLTITLDHGVAFDTPLGDCETYASLKKLLLGVFALANPDVRDELDKGEFDILDSENQVIRPENWLAFARAHLSRAEPQRTTIKISFRSEETRAKLSQKFRQIPVDVRDNENSGENSASQTVRRPTTTSTNDSDLLRPRSDEGLPSPDSEASLDVLDSYSEATDSEDPITEYASENGGRHPANSPSVSPKSAVAFTSSQASSRPSLRPHFEDDWYFQEDDGQYSGSGSDDYSNTAARPARYHVDVTPPHRAVPPLGQTGNDLAYLFDTETEEASGDSVHTRSISKDMNLETFKILKAVRTLSTEPRVQLHVAAGPENPWTAQFVDIHWYHLHGEYLNFAQFKDACLSVHGISERTKTLILKTLERVRRNDLKIFLGGTYIEPGTVVRGDEKNEDDPQSVIFSCVPYFQIQPQRRSRSQIHDDLHISRTLMETLYPYEPVRERDLEQVSRSHKRSSKRSPDEIIHVPAFWIMNIGRHAVVTCGHRSLSSEFQGLLTIREEDMKSLKPPPPVDSKGYEGIRYIMKSERNIKLTDWNGHVRLYSLAECRSYFHLEQKVRELRSLAQHPTSEIFHLEYITRTSGPNTQPAVRKLLPRQWRHLIIDENYIFIDISISTNQDEEEDVQDGLDVSIGDDAGTKSLVPSFSQWNSGVELDMFGSDNKTKDPSGNSETREPKYYFEEAESSLVCEYGDQALPKVKFAQLRTDVDLLILAKRVKDKSKRRTPHEAVVYDQISGMTMAFFKLVEIVQRISKLFVTDVNAAPFQRVWGTLSGICEQIAEFEKHGAGELEPANRARRGAFEWTIQPPIIDGSSKIAASEDALLFPSAVPGDEEAPNVLDISTAVKNSIEKCRRCTSRHTYHDPVSTLAHLRMHFRKAGARDDPDATQLKDNWIRSREQIHIEKRNARFLSRLKKAVIDSKNIFQQLQELLDGVQRPDGEICETYVFPSGLEETVQALAEYYITAGEELNALSAPYRIRKARFNTHLRYRSRHLEEINSSILTVRKELCNMARAQDHSGRLSFPAEYLCSWVIRHLLFRPTNNNMTIVEVYREYLLTLQFQVNHHPTKRLLRSLHLLQEEIAALQQVNAWQTKLVYDYCRVLDDQTYPTESRYRSAMYAHAEPLLTSCFEYLEDILEDYGYVTKRCGPLSESTKQSAEINEESHGKAILVFTLVTIIFLPLSFVTSYLGMNTADIRDMENKQSLYWEIAIPLTFVTILVILVIAYRGDDIRSRASSFYRRLTGREDTSLRGISVVQRRRAAKDPTEYSAATGYSSLTGSTAFEEKGTVRPFSTSFVPPDQIAPLKDPRTIKRLSFPALLRPTNKRAATQEFVSPPEAAYPSGPPARHAGRHALKEPHMPRHVPPYASIERLKDPYSYKYKMDDDRTTFPTRPSRRPSIGTSRYPDVSGPRHHVRPHRRSLGDPYSHEDAPTAYKQPRGYPFGPVSDYHDDMEPNPFAPPVGRKWTYWDYANKADSYLHSQRATGASRHLTAEYGDDPFAPPDPNAVTMLSRRDVDPETLSAFKVPWEYDSKNPSYYKILQYMPQWEQQDMITHTGLERRRKELKKEGLARPTYGSHRRDDSSEEDWPRRRRRPRPRYSPQRYSGKDRDGSDGSDGSDEKRSKHVAFDDIGVKEGRGRPFFRDYRKQPPRSKHADAPPPPFPSAHASSSRPTELPRSRSSSVRGQGRAPIRYKEPRERRSRVDTAAGGPETAKKRRKLRERDPTSPIVRGDYNKGRGTEEGEEKIAKEHGESRSRRDNARFEQYEGRRARERSSTIQPESDYGERGPSEERSREYALQMKIEELRKEKLRKENERLPRPSRLSSDAPEIEELGKGRDRGRGRARGASDSKGKGRASREPSPIPSSIRNASSSPRHWRGRSVSSDGSQRPQGDSSEGRAVTRRSKQAYVKEHHTPPESG